MDEGKKQEQRNAGAAPGAALEERPDGEGRLFTQEEVNRIVSERLGRAREKRGADREREAALEAREAALVCREYLGCMGYPAVLLDVLDTGDPAQFRRTVETLVEALGGRVEIRGAQTPTPPVRSGESADAAIAKAFRPKS